MILVKDETNGILVAQNMEFVAKANGLGVLFGEFFAICEIPSLCSAGKWLFGIDKGDRL